MKSSTRFADLINISEDLGENIKKHIPVFEFQLVELYRMPFEKILGTPLGILTLRALKAEKLQALLDDAVWDESLLIQLPSASFEMLMRYILDRDLDKPAFHRGVQTLRNPKLSKNAISLADQFCQEGRQGGASGGPPRRSYLLKATRRPRSVGNPFRTSSGGPVRGNRVDRRYCQATRIASRYNP